MREAARQPFRQRADRRRTRLKAVQGPERTSYPRRRPSGNPALDSDAPPSGSASAIERRTSTPSSASYSRNGTMQQRSGCEAGKAWKAL